jgi:8-oxo-dGTP pyrophosphatase MutT (NUDIX family)
VKHDYAAGGVVFRDDGPLQVLLIKDRYGHWTLPKGHLDGNESNEQAALREIAEETGVTGSIVAPLGTIAYQVMKKGQLRDKTVAFFLVRAQSYTTALPPDDEVQAVVWSAPEEALRRIDQYQQVRDILRAALDQLAS